MNTSIASSVFEIISQNADCVQTPCNDGNNPFNFANRKWLKDKFMIECVFSLISHLHI